MSHPRRLALEDLCCLLVIEPQLEPDGVSLSESVQNAESSVEGVVARVSDPGQTRDDPGAGGRLEEQPAHLLTQTGKEKGNKALHYTWRTTEVRDLGSNPGSGPLALGPSPLPPSN